MESQSLESKEFTEDKPGQHKDKKSARGDSRINSRR